VRSQNEYVCKRALLKSSKTTSSDVLFRLTTTVSDSLPITFTYRNHRKHQPLITAVYNSNKVQAESIFAAKSDAAFVALKFKYLR
jgi:hypothetical protein